MLVRLLYASRAATPLIASVQDSIMEQSRAHNPEMGITGVLCFSDDLFIQVLEGGRDAVCELYNTIVRDDRHQNVRILASRKSVNDDSAVGPWGRSISPRSIRRCC